MNFTVGTEYVPSLEENVHLDKRTVNAVFAVYDVNKENGLLLDNPALLALMQRIFPGRDYARAKYMWHQQGAWGAKGISIDFLIEGAWDGEHVTHGYRFDRGETGLRHANRVTQKASLT